LYHWQVSQGYTHETVNHSAEYAKADGVHTNQIKSLWSDAKRKLKAMNGARHNFLPSYLDEWMWRHKRDKSHYFNDLVKAIAENPKHKKCDFAVITSELLILLFASTNCYSTSRTETSLSE